MKPHSPRRKTVYREGDTLHIESLSHPNDVSKFLWNVNDAFSKAGYDYLHLDLTKVNRVFPNAVVPISAAIHAYRAKGYEITVTKAPQLVRLVKFDSPLSAGEISNATSNNAFSHIWRFATSDEVSILTETYAKILAEKVECEKGVVDAFHWCISEILDNVLQHSESTEGFVMVQIHSESKRVAICVADTGIGILASLRTSPHRPQNAVDAITLALKEGVTRDKEAHQGNGLWGLNEIVRENGGRLTIKSEKGLVEHDPGREVHSYNGLPTYTGTIIDFQLDASQIISLSRALSGHKPVSLRLEGFENVSGETFISVKDHAHGTGTRIAAKQLRNLVMTLFNDKQSRIALDFGGIGIVSSSFADELIGKLVIRFGFFNFQQVIELQNMNETVQAIVHRSVAQRMMESLKPKDSGDHSEV